MHIYGQMVHAFTNPEANAESDGLIYNEVAAKRGWNAMRIFLKKFFLKKR